MQTKKCCLLDLIYNCLHCLFLLCCKCNDNINEVDGNWNTRCSNYYCNKPKCYYQTISKNPCCDTLNSDNIWKRIWDICLSAQNFSTRSILLCAGHEMKLKSKFPQMLELCKERWLLLFLPCSVVW